MELEVNKPTVVKAEISDGVKAAPLIEAEFGFADIREMYFSASLSGSYWRIT
jgi:hypothetical protein